MKIFWSMTLSELKTSLRNIIFVGFSILMPLLLVILFGSLYGNEPSRLFSIGAVSQSLPAYLGLALTIIAFIGMPLQIVGYKENKVLKRLKATPVKKYQIILPILLNYLIIFLAGAVLLFISGFAIYGVSLKGNFFVFISAIILSVTTMFSLGFLISCLCTNVKQITAIGFTLLIPMIFLSGATMPLGAFPDAISNVAKAIPLTYCIEFLTNAFLGISINAEGLNVSNWLCVGILSAITVVCTLLSIKFFKWE